MDSVASTRKGKLQIIAVCSIAILVLGFLFFINFQTFPSTPSGSSSLIVFSAAGDYGTDAASWPVIRDHGGGFHLALGDFSYSGDPAGWCSGFKSFFNNVEIVSGNHDDGDIDGYVVGCPHTAGSSIVGDYGKAYYFDYPATNPLVRVILASPDVFDDGFSLAQNAIRDAKSRGVPWTVYGSHKVCIEPTGDKSCQMGKGLMDMLLNEGVDLILQAHAHTYSRSHQLRCADPDAYVASCVVDSDGSFAKGAGTVFVIQGIGGVSIRSSGWGDPDSDYFATTKGGDGCSGTIGPCSSADFGMVQYTITETSLQARVFYENGEQFDPWTIGSGGPLSSRFTFSPINPGVGQTVTFYGVSSGGSPPYSFAWDFGDSSTGTGSITTHSYSATSSYQVSLRLTDSASVSADAPVQTVTVTEAQQLSADFAFEPSSPVVNQSITFTATAPGGTPPYAYDWDFGDSNTDSGDSVSYSYSTSGSYEVSLVITDDQNNQVSVTKTVMIGEGPISEPCTLCWPPNLSIPTFRIESLWWIALGAMIGSTVTLALLLRRARGKPRRAQPDPD